MLNQEIKVKAPSFIIVKKKESTIVFYNVVRNNSLPPNSGKSYTLLLASFLLLLLDALQKLLRADTLQLRDLLGVLVIIGIPLQLLENLFELRPTRHNAPLAARPRDYLAILEMPGQSYARRVSQQNACHEYPKIRTTLRTRVKLAEKSVSPYLEHA